MAPWTGQRARTTGIRDAAHGRSSLILGLLLCLASCSEADVTTGDGDEIPSTPGIGDATGGSSDRFATLDTGGRGQGTVDDQDIGQATDDASGPQADVDEVETADTTAPPVEDASSAPDDAVIITPPGSPCEGVGSEPCYDGATDTDGIGACSPGIRTCIDGAWSLCVGQVLPSVEALAVGGDICTNGVDDDCDGLTDEDLDEDGDGFGSCSLDCCDAPNQGCGSLADQVSPAALDLPNNGLDDDCDGVVDGGDDAPCSDAAINSGITASDLVQAMDLCRFVDDGELGWGVLEASLSLADGSGQPQDIQLNVTESFGGIVSPVAHGTMAVMASGIGRGVGEEGFEDSNTHNAKTKSSPPQSYIDVHGALQTSPGCEAGSMTVRDSVRLRVRIRAPTNVHGLGFRFRFFSHEYPNYLCTKYNDFMLVLMEGASPALPEDGNVSFDASGNPISVNNAFFTTCEAIACYDSSVYPIQSGPDADNDGCVDVLTCNEDTNLCEGPFGACPDGADDIAAFTTDLAYAGATGWLTTQVPVIPGEELTLDFHIWDTSDAALDSLMLLDSFQWIYQSGIGLSTHQ